MNRFLLLLLLLSNTGLFGQGYNFTSFTSPYDEFSDGTDAININDWDSDSWDDPFCQIDLGFAFEIGGESFSTVYQQGVGAEWIFHSLDDSEVRFGPDLIDGDVVDGAPSSTITYKVEGAPGNRIGMIQYTDAAFYSEVTQASTANNRISLQIWFYEGDNSIEFRFGPQSIVDLENYEGTSGPGIAVLTGVSYDPYGFEYGISISGDPSNPTPVILSDSFSSMLDAYPQEDQVYRFAPGPLSTDSNPAESFMIYPTITMNELGVRNLKDPNAVYSIRSISGQIVDSGLLNNKNIDVSDLNAGIYFIQIDGFTQKFIKR
jgi:hypothetical protein